MQCADTGHKKMSGLFPTNNPGVVKPLSTYWPCNFSLDLLVLGDSVLEIMKTAAEDCLFLRRTYFSLHSLVLYA